MKTKNNKKELKAQVENQEVVANATEVTNTNPSQEETPQIKEILQDISTGDKPKKKDKKKTKKSKVVEMPAAKTKKKKDKVVKEVAAKQKDSIVEEVVAHREVKWIYPEDVTDTLARKQWRQKARNEYRRLEREMNKFIMDQESKDYKKARKAFEDYKKQVLKPGMAV